MTNLVRFRPGHYYRRVEASTWPEKYGREGEIFQSTLKHAIHLRDASGQEFRFPNPDAFEELPTDPIRVHINGSTEYWVHVGDKVQEKFDPTSLTPSRWVEITDVTTTHYTVEDLGGKRQTFHRYYTDWIVNITRPQQTKETAMPETKFPNIQRGDYISTTFDTTFDPDEKYIVVEKDRSEQGWVCFDPSSGRRQVISSNHIKNVERGFRNGDLVTFVDAPNILFPRTVNPVKDDHGKQFKIVGTVSHGWDENGKGRIYRCIRRVDHSGETNGDAIWVDVNALVMWPEGIEEPDPFKNYTITQGFMVDLLSTPCAVGLTEELTQAIEYWLADVNDYEDIIGKKGSEERARVINSIEAVKEARVEGPANKN